jgi:hypothetical protein
LSSRFICGCGVFNVDQVQISLSQRFCLSISPLCKERLVSLLSIHSMLTSHQVRSRPADYHINIKLIMDKLLFLLSLAHLNHYLFPNSSRFADTIEDLIEGSWPKGPKPRKEACSMQ